MHGAFTTAKGPMTKLSASFSAARGPLNGMASGMHELVPPQKPAVEAVVLMEGVEKKGRKAREGGGRGSRGGASRKRTRSGLPVELPNAGGGDLVNSIGGRATGTGRGAGGVRRRGASGEKGEKMPIRRQGVKREEKKASQASATSANDTLLHRNWTAFGSPSGSPGILDIYGLKTKPIDISAFMLDVPLSDLLSGNYKISPVCSKESLVPVQVAEVSYVQQIRDIFQYMPKQSGGFEAPAAGNLVSKQGRRPSKLVLDLESPLNMEGDSPPGLVNGEVDQQRDNDKPYAGANNEVCTEKDWSRRASGSSSVFPEPAFCVDNLPLYPFEEFMSRLQLSPSDPVELIVSKGEFETEARNLAGECSGPSTSHIYQHRTIPPFPFSLPPVCPVKAESDHRKGLKGGRASQQQWVSGTVSTLSRSTQAGYAGSSGLSHQEEPEIVGGNSGPMVERKSSGGGLNESNHDTLKAQGRVQVCSPDGLQTPSPLQEIGPRVASSVSLASPTVKVEARLVENAVGSSSNGLTSSMTEIDPRRQETGAGTAVILEKIEKAIVGVSHTPACKNQSGLVNFVKPPDVQVPTGGGEPTLRLSTCTGNEVESTAKEGDAPNTMAGQEVGVPVLEIRLQDSGQSSFAADDPSSSYSAMPGSPNAQAAAHLLCDLANSLVSVEETNSAKETRRRVFSPYGGAPRQRAPKASKNGASGSRAAGPTAENTSKGAAAKEPVCPTPSGKSCGERRKSLSQFNDPSLEGENQTPVKAPRGSSSRTAVGLRSNYPSHRGENGSKEGTRPRSLSPARGVKTTSVLGISRGAAAEKMVSLSPNGSAMLFTKLTVIGNSPKGKVGVDLKGARSSGSPHPILAGSVKLKHMSVANGTGRTRTVKSWKV